MEREWRRQANPQVLFRGPVGGEQALDIEFSIMKSLNLTDHNIDQENHCFLYGTRVIFVELEVKTIGLR
jgi:hypothetical protein